MGISMAWQSIKVSKCKPLTLGEVQWILEVANSCTSRQHKVTWIEFIRRQLGRTRSGDILYALLYNKRRELTDSLSESSVSEYTYYPNKEVLYVGP